MPLKAPGKLAREQAAMRAQVAKRAARAQREPELGERQHTGWRRMGVYLQTQCWDFRRAQEREARAFYAIRSSWVRNVRAALYYSYCFTYEPFVHSGWSAVLRILRVHYGEG